MCLLHRNHLFCDVSRRINDGVSASLHRVTRAFQFVLNWSPEYTAAVREGNRKLGLHSGFSLDEIRVLHVEDRIDTESHSGRRGNERILRFPSVVLRNHLARR